MDRSEEAGRILKEAEKAIGRKDHGQVLDLCDRLLAEYADVISTPGVQDSRAVALCGLGRFDEAEPVFRGFLDSHRRLGFPIASTTWMYHLLVCHYRGDEQKAVKEYVDLDETKAVAVLSREGVVEPADAGDRAQHIDLARCVEMLGERGTGWQEGWDAIKAADESQREAAARRLLPLVEAEDYVLRGRALNLLGEIGGEEALGVLKRASAISERDFRALIGTPRGATSHVSGVDIPVKDMLEEYQRWAEEAYRAVRGRVRSVSSDTGASGSPAPREGRVSHRWWRFWAKG